MEPGMHPSFVHLIERVMDRDVTEWPRTSAIVGTEFEGGVVVFFSMNDGVMLALYPSTGFGHDADVPEGAPGDA
jgi:hypothetical protein